jgi:ankyrin repeat protein
MLDWLGVGLGFPLVAGIAVWHCYRRQRQQDAVRIVNAIRAEDLPELSALLAERADFKSVAEWFGDPALIIAVKSAGAGFAAAAIELLLNYGAEINESGIEWKTALMHAAAEGHRELCETFLSRGADPNAKDMFGRTAAYWAEYGGDWKIIALLARNRPGA